MKVLNGLILALLFGVLAWAATHLPPRGDVQAPMHREISAEGSAVAGSYYIRHAYRDAHTENMVTVVLADYRGFDTLGETIVVFTAGIGAFLILQRRKR